MFWIVFLTLLGIAEALNPPPLIFTAPPNSKISDPSKIEYYRVPSILLFLPTAQTQKRRGGEEKERKGKNNTLKMKRNEKPNND